jgi:hypothetical protein
MVARANRPLQSTSGGGQVEVEWASSSPLAAERQVVRPTLHVHNTAVTRRLFFTAYFGATFTVWSVMFATQQCWEWQNIHQIPNMGLRDKCLASWSVSSVGVILLQLACIVMMAFPPRFIRDEVTSRMRVAIASFAVIVLLANPWTEILFVVMRGGTLG